MPPPGSPPRGPGRLRLSASRDCAVRAAPSRGEGGAEPAARGRAGSIGARSGTQRRTEGASEQSETARAAATAAHVIY